MKRRDFEREWLKRLEENKRLSDWQFLPQFLVSIAAWLATYLFYILVVGAGLLALATWGLFQGQIVSLNRAILLF